MGMKKYSDYNDDIKKVEWTKYVIIVPTEEDRSELMEAFREIHDCGPDAECVAVNQLIHEYLSEDDNVINNIVVDSETYNKLHVRR